MNPSVSQGVIAGGGFAGLFAARALRRAPVQVTLIDRAGHHLTASSRSGDASAWVVMLA
jgi:2-polyprenyl-6-methoxyphenol hydroxylase-like FAD-dependent oxidoreductase